MTAHDLEQLTDKIWKAVTQNIYDDNDIGFLIATALGQKATIELLLADNKRLTEAVETAGKHIQQLEPLSHLVQYSAEGSI
jgi:hypothetical protein